MATGTFGEHLTAWRSERGLSKKGLAEAMGFDRTYISHVEAGRQHPSEVFVQRAETVLNSGGALSNRWQETQAARNVGGRGRDLPPGKGLIVEHDDAELRYADGLYAATMRRRIYNAGPDPVTRYLVRISVDKYPGQPERSNQLYRQHPLTFEELALKATCDGQDMAWQVKFDRDAFKEVWLQFESPCGDRFPLYPGQRARLEYAYVIDEARWGSWFQRAVRLPTEHLSVRLVFPVELQAAVWGTETSPTAEAIPLPTPIGHHRDEEVTDVFDWAADHPQLNARYRLEWRFRAVEADRGRPSPPLRRASDRMMASGIIQATDPLLRQVARPYDLPTEADQARQTIEELFDAMQRVAEHHTFGKGMGLAAPQIGIPWAAAIVQPPGEDAEPIVLLNPRIVGEATEADEQYEGCLSFFDVRGMVPRPLHLEVEHTRLDGRTLITRFETAMARLVAHEVDHLHGRLYIDRMPEGTQPIPVEQYRASGQTWTYR